MQVVKSQRKSKLMTEKTDKMEYVVKTVKSIALKPFKWVWKGLAWFWNFPNMSMPIKVVVIGGVLSGLFLLGNTILQHNLSNNIGSQAVEQVKEEKLVHLEAEGDGNDQFALNNDSGYVTVNNYWDSDSNLQNDVKTLQTGLKVAADKIGEMEQSQDMNQLVKDIFERMKVEAIKPLEEGKMFVAKKRDDFAYVLFVLEDVPIPNTVELQYHIYTQPNGSFSTFDNVVLFNWADSVSKLEKKPFYLRYVADYGRANEKTKVFVKDGYLVAKDKLAFRLSDGQPFNILKKDATK